DLLADLELHKLDVVLTDHPAPSNTQLKVHSHSLGSSDIGWYGSANWWQVAHKRFPASLQQVPLLLPTTHSVVRGQLDRWLSQHGLRPRVVGEIEDSALLETFGSTDLGVFPAALAAEEELLQRSHVQLIGACEGVQQHYYAISTERKVMHPLVQQMLVRM
ncbi:MAG: LysR family transcriptional regulator, partial [Burkholderiales bacterium]|nr:LysR family transcriptional regulator [Burkholderiales bacterium]